ncbi:MAG: hypothetical protein HOI34_19160 [Rhodospirillaceae bacterium]|nr:hypothetical protein [Rhodospirillaceae bacterium]MBT6205798.1 hypothetical protein [Rhodospirillaceae bacterium]MBT6512662.1 hypothetical protein [Rhodospirillaceae bacterium]MBT7646301.1 hypothetical protein [Rhodospirillaceae bacterium]
MLTRLAGILIGGWYFAVVWFAKEEGYIRRGGIDLEEYGIIAGTMGLIWLVGSALALWIVKAVTRGKPGSIGAFNGIALGVIALGAMLPLHLLYGPRHQTGQPFALDEITVLSVMAIGWFAVVDLPRLVLFRLARLEKPRLLTVANLAFLGTVAGIAYMADMTVGGELRGAIEGVDTPTEAITFVIILGLAAGIVLTIIIELPRALIARGRHDQPVRDIGSVGASDHGQEEHSSHLHAVEGEGTRVSQKPDKAVLQQTVVRY